MKFKLPQGRPLYYCVQSGTSSNFWKILDAEKHKIVVGTQELLRVAKEFSEILRFDITFLKSDLLPGFQVQFPKEQSFDNILNPDLKSDPVGRLKLGSSKALVQDHGLKGFFHVKPSFKMKFQILLFHKVRVCNLL
ncbi:hypothetical protein QWY93_17790 [Echinicola jeungdonensis]|uniref:Uncharacterized protein n=1 Tax=Echinicola jeungdonensis TaxID=709343 RepID=A0ABV5J067_9BACT|nr:hypothetical protein [Echinicola jeungdonensis]MDN3671169.1 hypothetical protein [Echinicola jeungdonensis]